MPLTALTANIRSTLSCNKENQHKKKTKVLAANGSETHLRRRRRRGPATQTSHGAPGAAIAHAAMRRFVRQGRKQRDQQHSTSERHHHPHHLPPQPSNSEPEPMSIVPPSPTEEASTSQQQQLQQERKPVVSGLKYNFPRFLPRYPMPAIKAEAFAAIDEQLRDIPIQFILDDILINLAPVYVFFFLI